jgi:arsenite-transporting ATPase
MEGTLRNVLEQETLKWIFVGGKGGVGKTTTSCALALQLATVRDSVLLISTDPAHNLSDAFSCKFTKDPMLVPGTSNVYAMEIDPTASLSEFAGTEETRTSSPLGMIMGELSGALPGIDEAMGFAQVMKLVQSMPYDVVVFDTAPTGHTLRFLSFPTILEKALGKLQVFGGGLMAQVSSLMGMPAQEANALMQKVRDLSDIVHRVNAQFQDPDLTTFVCVAIAEFLSLYETERLIQELLSYNIDVHNVVVNQLLFPKDSECKYCQSRWRIQCKYLEQMDDLYVDDFHLVKVPMLPREVRGVDSLRDFSHNLLTERRQ